MPTEFKRMPLVGQRRHEKIPVPLSGVAVLLVIGLLNLWGLFELQRAPYPTGGTLLGAGEIEVVWLLLGITAAIDFGSVTWFILRISQWVFQRS